MATETQDTTIRWAVILHSEQYGDIQTCSYPNERAAEKDVKAFTRLGKRASVVKVEVA